MLTYLSVALAGRLVARTERGTSAVEYGLMVAGVVVACILAWKGLEHTLIAVFKDSSSQVMKP